LDGGEVTVTSLGDQFDAVADAVPKYHSSTMVIRGDEWRLERFLGAGAFGQVYRSLHVPTGSFYVMKLVEQGGAKEVEFLKSVPAALWRHPNLVTYFGIIEDVSVVQELRPACHIIVMDFVPYGELFDLVVGRTADPLGALSEGTMRRFMHDLIDGLHELTVNGIAHRDLKPENLFLGEGRLVIGDLGHSKRKHDAVAEGGAREDGLETRSLGTVVDNTVKVGTSSYWPPEKHTLTDRRVRRATFDSERADVFTLGIVAFQMTQQELPFKRETGGISKVREEGPREQWWEQFPSFQNRKGLKEMLQTLWRKDPSRRPDFRQLHRAKSGDESVLADFPALRWLADEVSGPQEFLAEVRQRLPRFTVHPEAAAPHEGQAITLEELSRMVEEGRHLSLRVHSDAGRLPRYLAFEPKEGGEGLEAFSQQARTAYAYLGFQVAAPPDSLESARLVTMPGDECRLRLLARAIGGVLVLQSLRAWGSAVDEVSMMQAIAGRLEKTWGPRAALPEELQHPDSIGGREQSDVGPAPAAEDRHGGAS